MALTLRRATLADVDVTFAWANDPETRAASFHSAAIAREEHERWLRSSLEGARRVLLIAEREALPVGVLRFDRSLPESAEIGITIAPQRRGQGLAGQLLQAGMEHARGLGLRALVARIRPDNARSIRSFTRAGFQLTGPELAHGQPALRYELRI